MSRKLPNRVREWRQKRGYSLSDIQELTGFTRSETSKIELGGRGLRHDKLTLLSAALQAPPRELVHLEDHEEALKGYPGDPAAVATPPPEMELKLRLRGKPLSNAGLASPARDGGAGRVPLCGMVQDGKVTRLGKVLDHKEIRLPIMEGAYCVYNPGYVGDAIKPGDIMVITPGLPPKVGDVVFCRTGDEGVFRILDKAPQPGEAVHKVGCILPC